jgi:hypothetical protein
MKKALQLLAVVLLLPMYTFAQTEWEFQNVIPADSSLGEIHGVAFDGDGNVWVGSFRETVVGGNNFNRIYCFTTDGQPCAAVPYVDGTVTGDTLLRFGRVVGMASDPDGNILVSSHGFRLNNAPHGLNSSRAFVHRVDPNTGDGLGVADITVMRTETVSHAFHIAADRYGDIFYSAVFPGQPIRVMDADFNFQLNVSDNRAGFARAIAVFTDDNDVTRVYQPSNFVTEFIEGTDTLAVGGRVEIHEGDVIAGFSVLDTLSLIGMDPGAAAVYPGNGVLFVPASGSGNNPEGDPELWHALTIYGINVKGAGDIEVVDQLTWEQGEGDTFNPIYRALAISQDGLDLAVGGFASAAPVQLFSRDEPLVIETSAGEPLTELPQGYNLSQNYPNPFNPTTQINFEIGQSGMATLKVYDLLGREVATLVNSELPAGSHSVNFDAANLASGTYMYRLEANGFVLTRKMMLVK